MAGGGGWEPYAGGATGRPAGGGGALDIGRADCGMLGGVGACLGTGLAAPVLREGCETEAGRRREEAGGHQGVSGRKRLGGSQVGEIAAACSARAAARRCSPGPAACPLSQRPLPWSLGVEWS